MMNVAWSMICGEFSVHLIMETVSAVVNELYSYTYITFCLSFVVTTGPIYP